jgi:hypothetical protein
VGRSRRTLIAALAVLASGIVAGAAAAALSPGVYQARIAGATPAALDGTWRMSFAAGQYEITRNGAIAIDGAVAVHGDRIAFTDRFGPYRCLGKQAKGTYRWRLAGKKLTLAVVSDRCAGRKAVLSHAFTKRS